MQHDEHRDRRRATRRQFLRWGLLVSGLGLAAACAPAAAPAPTAAPADSSQAQKAEAPKPTDAAKPAAPAPAPAASPAGAAPAPAPAASPAVAQPAATAAPAVKPEMAKVKAGVIATLAEQSWIALGVQRGLLRDEGIDLEFTEFRDGGTQFKGLLAGEIDLYEGGLGTLPPAIAQGADVKILGGSKPGLASALYTRKDIDKLEDLYGKDVGTASPGSFLHLILVGLFQVKNLDINKIQIANIGASGDVYKAVEAGKVAAGVSLINFKPQADQNPAIKTFLIFDDVLPDYPRTGFAVTGKTLAEKSDLLVRTCIGWMNSYRYGIAHLSEVLDIAVNQLQFPKPAMEFFFPWEVEHRVIAPNLEITPKQLTYMQELNMQGKIQDQVLPVEKVFDPTVRDKVLAKLGRFEWKTSY